MITEMQQDRLEKIMREKNYYKGKCCNKKGRINME
ncbi:hypothetical protein CR513_45978 [Mucuna pruriens]|uniref:Uncharacterized protein n=1 Tax=Mucuna pruriens TaxID=157652 RepID=A0A371F836_MUCPR|nr:hypothetical protein CR513_45978 [Mucuna pruriens]